MIGIIMRQTDGRGEVYVETLSNRFGAETYIDRVERAMYMDQEAASKTLSLMHKAGIDMSKVFFIAQDNSVFE